MKVLNACEKVSLILEYDYQQTKAWILEAMKRRYVKRQRQYFSLAIDATECSSVIDISTILRAILGGSFPNHILKTENTTKDKIKSILDKTEYYSIKIIKA